MLFLDARQDWPLDKTQKRSGSSQRLRDNRERAILLVSPLFGDRDKSHDRNGESRNNSARILAEDTSARLYEYP